MKKKNIFKIMICLVLVCIISVICVDGWVRNVGGENIIKPSYAEKLENVDCIVVLGCQVKENGKPSDMLGDRLKRGIALYKNGAAPKIIMSGDHGRRGYDEVNAMKKAALDAGIPSKDIFMDHAGFSTYESIYRAKEIFKADKIIVVTHNYHLYRTLYIAKQFGIEAYGVNSDYRTYLGQTNREIREILARCKDFVKCIFKPEPTFLGEVIPVSGDGNATND